MDDSTNLALRLSQIHDDGSGLPGLVLQTDLGVAPDYNEALYRIFFVTFGTAKIRLNHQMLELQAHDMLTLSPGDAVRFETWTAVRSFAFHHNFFCIRVQREEVFCDGVVFNRLHGHPVVRFPKEEVDVVQSRFLELERIVSDQGPFAQDRAVGALRSLLLQAADFKMRSDGGVCAAGETPHLSKFILQFQHLVEATYRDKKDIAFYSEALGVTEATLNRRVKAELGQTVLQAVNERLAIEARVALRAGDRSVKEVAFELGFGDPLYFSRFFKKHFGLSPSQYFEDPLGQTT